jgi:hypothetical protein
MRRHLQLPDVGGGSGPPDRAAGRDGVDAWEQMPLWPLGWGWSAPRRTCRLVSTRGALKRAVSSNHSHAVLFPPGHGWHADPLPYRLPSIAWSRPHSPLVRTRYLHWLTDSCISNRFHVFCTPNRQINEDLRIPFFADHIRALTESFDSKLADAGNSLDRQLGRHLCRPRAN